MIVTEINDNIFKHFEEKKFDGLIHCANCFHIMGGGLAKIIARRYPAAYDADKRTPRGTREKLGTYSKASTQFGDIINLYGQFDIGTDKMRVEYDSIKKGMELINKEYSGKRLCLSKIGAGLAGGNWDIIKSIINESTPDVELTLIWL